MIVHVKLKGLDDMIKIKQTDARIQIQTGDNVTLQIDTDSVLYFDAQDVRVD